MIPVTVASSSSARKGAPTIGAGQRRPLLPLDEAVAIVVAAAPRLPAERVPLADAQGRVLAEPLATDDDVPPFDNSAMDGYALRSADSAAATPQRPVRLRLAGESRAGAPAAAQVGAGDAFAISTGAVLPAGADAVVRVEDAEADGTEVLIAQPVPAGAEIRRAGDDIRAGQEVLASGAVMGPAELGVAASAGAGEVTVARRPRLAVIATGDELADPGKPLRPGQIRNTNGVAVPAQARGAGAALAGVQTVGDDADATRQAIAGALDADVLVICGGVSVGPHDHVKPALAALGVEERFWGIALRPGRPTWFGVAPGGGLVFGLPGNPVSAMVTFRLLVVPALRAMTGHGQPDERVSAVLDDAYPKRPGRLHAVRCALSLKADGWHARSTGPQGSHVLTSMLGADGLALIPQDAGDVPAGAAVDVLLLRDA